MDFWNDDITFCHANRMKDVLQKYVIAMLSSNKESKSIMYLNFLNIRNFDSLNFKMQ
jgi:hypothetical protein